MEVIRHARNCGVDILRSLVSGVIINRNGVLEFSFWSGTMLLRLIIAPGWYGVWCTRMGNVCCSAVRASADFVVLAYLVIYDAYISPCHLIAFASSLCVFKIIFYILISCATFFTGRLMMTNDDVIQSVSQNFSQNFPTKTTNDTKKEIPSKKYIQWCAYQFYWLGGSLDAKRDI